MGRLGAVSNAAVAVNCDVHREPPSVPLVLSRALVAVWGMHREERSCISPVTLRACKLQRSNTRWGKTERWRSASRPLCEPTTVVGWCFPGDFAKRGCKRARFAEPHIKSDFGHRQFACCQQALGAFDALVGEIAVRRHVERLLERAGKMVWAQVYQLGQGRQGDVLGKVFFDVLRELLLLPFRKPAANARHARQAALVHAHELASQSDAERFGIGGLPLIRTPHLRPELDSGIPEIAVKKQQPRAKLDFGEAKVGLQQRAAWVDVEVSAATQRTRFLPT